MRDDIFEFIIKFKISSVNKFGSIEEILILGVFILVISLIKS